MYQLIDGVVYKIQEVTTGTQNVLIKSLAYNVIYNPDTEEFEEVEPEEVELPPSSPTVEQQLTQLQQDNLTLMLGITALYELLLGGE